MAAHVLRRFGFKKSEPRESEARIKLQKELFAFNKCIDHGFPHKPSAMAYDAKLSLIAIGTKSGSLRIYGSPGVEFTGQHKDDVSVLQLFFLPQQARLISLCSDNSLHMWAINMQDGLSVLEHTHQFAMEASKLKTISACCLTQNAEQLLMGTEGGNIHVLDIATFQLSDTIIYQDVVTQNAPDDFKVNPGAVEDISQQPESTDKFLIGYNRGLIVLWDNKENNADQTYNASQQLESLTWHRDGTQFMSAHSDGSYIVWSSTDSSKPHEQATTRYGPFPCKAIGQIQWKTAKGDSFVMFSGGMPRASYGDRHTISVKQGGLQHVVFDFTSRVVDFVTMCSSNELDHLEKMEYDAPHSLLVLTEEELVAIDLQSDGWPTYRQPYLCSLHSSAITCAQHVTDVPAQLWTKILDAGEQQMPNYTTREWPVQGGKSLQQDAASHHLLLTGHEDGSVRFWDASTVSLSLLYKLNTASLFGEGAIPDQPNTDADEEWPPFRKVGTFDPYSDDPRLGIQKIALCALSETLVVGGTAGQVVLFEFNRDELEREVTVVTLNVVSDRDSFVWKGHKALAASGGDVKFAAGFQPIAVIQLHPPAACTAVCLQSEIQLIAVGTAHGFGVFDYAQKVEITTKCTLNPTDLSGTGESAMSRRKSFKKSLRESFRRLRKGRSGRGGRRRGVPAAAGDSAGKSPDTQHKSSAAAAEGPSAAEGATASPEGGATPSGAAGARQTEAPPSSIESPRGVERQVEARSSDDTMASMVRFLVFADTFLLSAQSHTPTLWAGTNAGTVYIYQVTMPASDKRDSEKIQCQLAKEIQLKHHAPVINIGVIDRNAQPLPAPLEVQNERVRAPDMSGGHQVVICSEEQLKIFSLPHLKALNKYKLTAHDGNRIRKIGFVNFRSRSDERYSENDLACLTNQGDLEVFTLPQLRKQLRTNCIRKDNVSGIVSSVFTRHGEGFYLNSPSEFVRFSMSARCVLRPICLVEVRDGVRPAQPEPVEDVAAAESDVVVGDAADKPNLAAQPAEGSTAELTDSFCASGDTTGDITVDSVKVHMSDETRQDGKTLVSSSVVTKTTVVTATSGDGPSVTRQTTTVVTSSQPGPGGDAGATGSNIDDDTKLTGQGADEPSDPLADAVEPLTDLWISEDGDDQTKAAAAAGAPPAEQGSAPPSEGQGEKEREGAGEREGEERRAIPTVVIQAPDDDNECVTNGDAIPSAANNPTPVCDPATPSDPAVLSDPAAPTDPAAPAAPTACSSEIAASVDDSPSNVSTPNDVEHTANTSALPETSEPTDGATQIAEGTTQPAEGTPQPAEGTPQPAEVSAQPAEVSAQPAEVSAQPAEGTTQAAEGTTQPVEGTTQPAEGTTQPAEGTTQPAEGATQSAKQT